MVLYNFIFNIILKSYHDENMKKIVDMFNRISNI